MPRIALALITLAIATSAHAQPPPSPSPSWPTLCGYLIANQWPHAVRPYPKEPGAFVHLTHAEEQTAGLEGVQFHLAIVQPGAPLCIGDVDKGAGLLETPDATLLHRSCELGRSEPMLSAHAKTWFEALVHSAGFRHARTVAAKLAYLRHGMVEACTRDRPLEKAISRRTSLAH